MTRRSKRAVLAELESIEPSRCETIGFSYEMALSLTSYLEDRKGLDGLVSVLNRLADGDDIDGAMKHVYSEDYGGICRRWSEQLKREETGR
jgi:hypothetical protein